MHRRPFILSGVLSSLFMSRLSAAEPAAQLEEAAQVLDQSVQSGLVRAAVIVARIGQQRLERAFGAANVGSSFLLGSISKPIAITALMTLYDQRAFQLDDPVRKFVPEFTRDGRDEVLIRHLLTHVSGLPDQLPENARLRKSHAPLAEFVRETMSIPLGFKPGTKYEYSSMGILLATEIAQRITQTSILDLVQEKVLTPLEMKRSAIGLGNLRMEDTVAVQIEHAAPEAGGGDPTAKEWDWNSTYWRKLGAPWGGVHASAGDVLKFLDAFASDDPKILSAETARLMTRNHNQGLLVPRGLGFAVGPVTICQGCSNESYGHTGSTGTVAWCDPTRQQACVVFTSLPAQAVKPHPRDLASGRITRAAC